MIVYMLFNEGTEKAYIGKTTKNLDARWKEHVEDALLNGSHLLIHKAIRDWGTEVWTKVVLETCEDERSLAEAESKWIEACYTLDEGVGYNSCRGLSAADRALKWYAKELAKKAYGQHDGTHSYKKRANMTEEELKQYREWGMKGSKTRAQMSEEEIEKFREWGRRGAIKSQAIALNK